MKLSFSGKIIALVIFTVLAVSLAIAGSTWYFLNNGLNEKAQEDISIKAKAAQYILDQSSDSIKNLTYMIASRPDIAAAVAAGDTPAIQRMSKEIMRETGIALITIADAKGKVVGRGHSDQAGDSIMNQINVAKALAGQTTVGLEEGSAVKFSLRAGSPLRLDGKVVGSVTAGLNLSSSNTFVDTVKKMLGAECTIFHGDTRVTTTIEKDGKRAIGTKMDNPAVLEAVIAKGGSFFNINKILGRDYNTAYWPIVGADGKTAGMLFIGKDRFSIEQANDQILTSVIVSAGVVGLITILLGYLFALATVRPMKSVMAFARQVATGDLNAKAEGKFSGEMEELKKVIEAMVVSLREKIGEAQALHAEAESETEKARVAMAEAEQARREADVARREGILHAAEKLGTIVERVTSSSEELSAQVEEIRVGAEVQQGRVQETVTAIEQMNATVLDVARNAAQAAGSSENTKTKALDGARSVKDTVKSIEQVATVAGELRTEMHHLGKLTDSIGQVMGVINDIADQTNLLALNAAIEAARAGDAGRGFAVVADEVRKLAEKTMTATKEVGQNIRSIQSAVALNISKVDVAAETIAATNGLSGESGQVLGQIVTLAEGSYSEVQSIAAASEEQSAASEEISRAMGEINLIASKTFQGMSESAEAVRDLARLAVELQGLLQEMRTM